MSQSLAQYGKNLQNLVNSLSGDLTEQMIVPPASRLLGNIKNRVQRDGKNSQGQNIGQYSEKAMYANRKQFKKTGAFKAQGQNGFKGEKVVTKGKGKNKTYSISKSTPKSMYLQHGYKQLRDIQGMPTDIVNFTYRGDLLLDYKMVASNQKVLLGLSSEKQVKKRKGLEAKFGEVLPAMKSEIREYVEEVNEIHTELIIKKLRGY